MTELRLHFGADIPAKLQETIAKWPTDDLTPNWLEMLPETVQRAAETFEITFEPEILETGLTLVLLGHSRQLGPVVFKSMPIANELRSEAAALRLAGGDFVSRLLHADLDRQFILIERIVPGTQLREVLMPDEQSTRLAAHLATKFWRDVDDPSELQPLEQWMGALLNWKSQPSVIPDELTEPARRIARELLTEGNPPKLLHGDLQHHNILEKAGGEWIIIDPKGVHGDPGFEVCAWMYNPPGVQDQPNYREMTKKRLSNFAEIWDMDVDRLTRWAFAGSVLSAAWSADGSTWLDWFAGQIKVAQTLQTLISD